MAHQSESTQVDFSREMARYTREWMLEIQQSTKAVVHPHLVAFASVHERKLTPGGFGCDTSYELWDDYEGNTNHLALVGQPPSVNVNVGSLWYNAVALIRDAAYEGVHLLLYDPRIRPFREELDYTTRGPHDFMPIGLMSLVQTFTHNALQRALPVLSIWYGDPKTTLTMSPSVEPSDRDILRGLHESHLVDSILWLKDIANEQDEPLNIKNDFRLMRMRRLDPARMRQGLLIKDDDGLSEELRTEDEERIFDQILRSVPQLNKKGRGTRRA